MRRVRWGLWMILLVGAFLRLSVFVVAQPWTEAGETRILKGSKDIRSYHFLAHDWVLEGRYGGNPQADPCHLDPVIRPMGYALFVALWYWLFAPQLWIPLLVQVILSIASIALVYSITRLEFGERAARIAAWMFALFPNGILFASSLMTETVYIFATLLFLRGWVHFKQWAPASERSSPLLKAALLGALFAMSVYVRVSTIYLVLLIPLALWFALRGASVATRLRTGGIFFLTTLTLIMPYSLYMYQRYGTPRLTMVDDYNLLVNTVGHALGGRQGRIDPEALAFKGQLAQELDEQLQRAGLDPYTSNPFERAPHYRRLAIEYIRQYPGEILWGCLQGMFRFWFWPDRLWEVVNEVLPSRTPARGVLVGGVSFYAFTYHAVWLLLLAAGVWRALRTHRDWFWIFSIVALYLTLTANAAGNDRFRMQSAAFAFPLVGLGGLALRRPRNEEKDAFINTTPPSKAG